MVVIAHNAAEMAHAQTELVSWAEGKMRESLAVRSEVAESLATAEKNKWGTRGLKVAIKQAQQQHEFYHKMVSALRLGYVIVPNLPIDVFAIRTTSDNPRRLESRWRSTTHEQKSNTPPLGEGRYVGALPNAVEDVRLIPREDGKGTMEHYRSWAESFRDVVFPIRTAKAQVMDDTGRAMAEKLFDEIGIAPQGVIRAPKKNDPMVVGQIIYRPKQHRVSFLVAWWMSNRDIEIPA